MAASSQAGAERWAWALVALLCLFVGSRVGALRASARLEAAAEERLEERLAEELKRAARGLRCDEGGAVERAVAERAEGGYSGEAGEGGEGGYSGEEGAASAQGLGGASARAPLSAAQAPTACPPCPCAPKPRPKPAKGRRLPPPPPMTPVERQRLLAWARAQSEGLRRCRDAGQPIYRLTATVTLKPEGGGVKAAELKGEDVPAHALRCIRDGLLSWPAPPNISAERHPRLVFSLQLD